MNKHTKMIYDKKNDLWPAVHVILPQTAGSRVSMCITPVWTCTSSVVHLSTLIPWQWLTWQGFLASKSLLCYMHVAPFQYVMYTFIHANPPPPPTHTQTHAPHIHTRTHTTTHIHTGTATSCLNVCGATFSPWLATWLT